MAFVQLSHKFIIVGNEFDFFTPISLARREQTEAMHMVRNLRIWEQKCITRNLSQIISCEENVARVMHRGRYRWRGLAAWPKNLTIPFTNPVMQERGRCFNGPT